MILADDEPVITKGIRMLIDWDNLGIEIVAVCHEGKSALHEILTRKPDLAILDISMPGKTGIEILKELRAAQAKTQVIFVSGFQDFSYARDALTYGAVEYLLKPVKREALLEAVGKCLPGAQRRIAQAEEPILSAEDAAYRSLSRPEATNYRVAAVVIPALADREEMERQLITFSVFSQLEQLTGQREDVTAFQKREDIYLILSSAQPDRGDEIAHLESLARSAEKATGWALGIVVSPSTAQMADVPVYAAECRKKCAYFYFWPHLPQTILPLAGPVFPNKDLAGFRLLQNRIADSFVGQDWNKTAAMLEEYTDACAAIADGKQDSAVYYLLSCLREITDRMAGLGMQENGAQLVDGLLESARHTKSYTALLALFEERVEKLHTEVSENLRKNDRKDIVKATDYIDRHYRENLTLEVLAGQIHMNPFYFSSYFKKQTGQNFKDYLNRVRMRHALELLIGTDKRNYEIAEEVGFKDYRYFTELFSRQFGRTPAAYRKAMRAAGETADAEEGEQT